MVLQLLSDSSKLLVYIDYIYALQFNKYVGQSENLNSNMSTTQNTWMIYKVKVNYCSYWQKRIHIWNHNTRNRIYNKIIEFVL